MPIDEHAIIEPRKGKHEELLPQLAVLVFTPQDVELFLHHSPSLQKRSQRFYLSDVYTGSPQDVPLAVVGPMLGAPQTVLVLEKLIALGVTRVLAAGWCGSLQTHVKIGDLVLPTGAFSDEGTSPHYPVEATRPGPSPELFNTLKEVLAAEEHPVHEGMVWSTDAPFRETKKKVMNYQQKGALAVEMETSALFTVAAFRNIHLAAALVVSDDLSAFKWVHGFRDRRFMRTRENLMQSLLRVVSSTMQGKMSKG